MELLLLHPDDPVDGNPEQLFGLPVGGEDDAALEIGHDDRVVRRIEQVQIPRLPFFGVPQHHPGERDADRQQQRGGQACDLEQQSPRPASSSCQATGKAVLQRSQPLVAEVNFLEDGRDSPRVRTARGDLVMERLPQPFDSGNIAIADRPDGDRPGHVADVTEPPEEPRHAGDVIGVITSLYEALPDHSEVRLRLLELETSLPVTQGDCEGSQVLRVVVLIVRMGVPRQMVDGILLSLRPEAFAPHVGPHGREDLHLRAGEHEQASDDEDEEEHDEGEFLGKRHELQEVFHGVSHRRGQAPCSGRLMPRPTIGRTDDRVVQPPMPNRPQGLSR